MYAFSEGTAELSVIRGLKHLNRFWTLNGGGALVYHLRHRPVQELDFFRELSHWTEEAAAYSAAIIIPEGFPEWKARRLDLALQLAKPEGVSKLYFEKITLSFVRSPKITGSIARITDGTHISVVSLQDIAGIKLFVLLDRYSAKDYIDLAAIIEHGWTATDFIIAGRAITPLRQGHVDLAESFRRMAKIPDEADDYLTQTQYTSLLTTSAQGLALLNKIM